MGKDGIEKGMVRYSLLGFLKACWSQQGSACLSLQLSGRLNRKDHKFEPSLDNRTHQDPCLKDVEWGGVCVKALGSICSTIKNFFFKSLVKRLLDLSL